MRRRYGVPALLALVLCSACSSGSTSAPTVASSPDSTVVASVPDSAATVDSPPRVDLIAPAIAAVEAKLGGPQEFFEINATSKLVNVIVALNDDTLAQYWLYLDGELSSQPAQDAQGNTFASSAVTFDPDRVLAQIEHDLPSSSIDLFVVEGGPDGSVRYTAIVTSPEGGQLQVIVGPDGKVVQVDADTGVTTTTGG